MDPNQRLPSGKNGRASATTPAAETETAPPVPMTVAIGASSGGLESLEHIFIAIPADCDLAFVVVMHFPPDGPPLLADLIRPYTSMEVLTAEDGMPLRPNTVYVPPPGRELTVSGGRLQLHAPEKSERLHPIDRFFSSLAADRGTRALAVVLSGFGQDGSEGVKRIKEEGGIVLVQEPETAVNPAMPWNAIATGAADAVLPAEEIADKIAEIARGECHLPPRACLTTTLDEDLQAVFAIVKTRTGHDFSAYKRTTVLRRIERRMALNESGGLKKYLAILEQNPREAQAFCQEILIGVTNFFRDPDAFQVIGNEIIPRLFANRDPDDPVRIWHACCASGEEAYSVAMLIREHLEKENLQAKVQIFATDIDETAVAQARAGIYADESVAELDEERLKRFFTRSDGRWQVAKSLREMIVFAHHSIIKDPPFSRLDLLVCRNFLIYLDPEMQKRLLTLFHLILKPGGILFLGASESVGRNPELFAIVDQKWKIFQRLESGRRQETFFPFSGSTRRLIRTAHPQRTAEAGEPTPGTVAEKLLMERYAPPCVLVNEKYEVLHISTRTQRFLEIPVGGPTLDILRMAREELRPALRAAIYKAFTEQKQVAFRGVKVIDETGEAAVNVLVEPLAADPAYGKLAMVILEPASAPTVSPASSGFEALPGDESSKDVLIRQLEEQLRITIEQLRATSEQLETSNDGFLSANEELMSINEEFQSTNEELQSTNEELETSKEELQALNEELSTVNAELQGKVEELNQSTSDMENLFASSEIAAIFLDRGLIIKRFSPAMAAIFNLIPADIGRPFRHLAGTIDWPDLPRDAQMVLEKIYPVEREVTALENGRSFIMRVLPYRTTDGRIDGVVVTLIDISQRKWMEKKTVHLASFPQMNPNPVLEVDSTGRVTFANPATKNTLERLGLSETDTDVFIPPDLHDILGDWDRREDFVIHREIELNERLFGETIFFTSQFQVARIYVFDITEHKRMEEALRESEQRVRRKLESILSPEGDIGDLDLADIIDTPSLQTLVDNFYKLTKIPMGLIDLKGKVLVGVGWQDICTRFHRVHPQTCQNCIESDIHLSAGVPHGEYKIYKCKNNLWDVATPVMVGDRQFGNLFIGQFFFEDEPLDYGFFRAQARQYGFDETKYLAALEAVPRLNRETLHTGMSFFMQLADLLSKLSYSNLKLARSLTECDAIMDSLRESEERFRTMFEHHQAIMLLIEPESGAIVDANDAAAEFYGHSRETLRGMNVEELNQLKPEEQRNPSVFPHLLASGEIRWVEVSSTPIEAQGEILLFSIIHDITDRKRAEEEIRRAKEEWELTFDSVPDLIAILDNRHRVLRVNAAMARRLGAKPEECVGLPCYEVVHGSSCPPGICPHSQTIADGREHTEELHEARLGGDFLVTTTPLLDTKGERIGSVHIAHDITERKRAEEEIRRRVEELRHSNEELARFNRASVGRELRMIALKKEVNALCEKIGESRRYLLKFEEEESTGPDGGEIL